MSQSTAKNINSGISASQTVRTTMTGAIGNTETQIIGMATPANLLQVGSTIRITAIGIHTNTTTASTGIYRVRIGATTLTGNIPASNSFVYGIVAKTNVIIKVQALLTILAIGTGGTIIGQVHVDPGFASGTTPTGTTATVVVDTASAKLIELTYISGAVSTTETFHSAVIEILSK